MRSEEIPEEPDEPEEEPEQAPAAAAVATMVPSVAGQSREFEYRTEELKLTDLAGDLAGRLTEASKDGWDFVQIVDAGESRLIVYRRSKRPERQARPVGFFPPAKS